MHHSNRSKIICQLKSDAPRFLGDFIQPSFFSKNFEKLSAIDLFVDTSNVQMPRDIAQIDSIILNILRLPIFEVLVMVPILQGTLKRPHTFLRQIT